MTELAQRFSFDVVGLAEAIRHELFQIGLVTKQKYTDTSGRERTKIYPPDMGGFRFDPASNLVFYRYAYWHGAKTSNPTPADFKRQQVDYHLSSRLGLPVRMMYSEAKGIFFGVALDGNPENFLAPSKRSCYLSPAARAATLTVAQPEEIPLALPIPEVVGYEVIGNPYAGGELSFTLGAGAGEQILTASLEDMNNILVAGKSKSGKSTFLRNLMAQALVAELQRQPNDPPRVQVGMIDLEQITFNGDLFRGLPQVFGKGVVTTEAEVLRFLAGLEGEINRRQALYQLAPNLPENLKEFNQVVRTNQKLPVLLVFVEEITALAGTLEAKFLEPLQRLIIRCRKYGVYFILSGQNFRANVIDKVISETCDASFLFGEANGETMRVLNFEAKQRLTEYRRGRGIARLFGQQGVQEFQGVYLPKTNFMDLINHFRSDAGLEEVGKVNRLDRVEEKASVQSQLTPEQALVLGLIKGNKSLGLDGLHRELWQMGYTVPEGVVVELVGQLGKLGKLVLKETAPAPVAVQGVSELVQTEAATPAAKPIAPPSDTVTQTTPKPASEELTQSAIPGTERVPAQVQEAADKWKAGATTVRKLAEAMGIGATKAQGLLSSARALGLIPQAIRKEIKPSA